jgi:hypothetical protein
MEMFTKASELTDFVAFKPFLGLTYFAMGDAKQARRFLDEALAERRTLSESVGLAYCLGDTHLAFQILEELLTKRSRGMNWLTVLPEFNVQRDDPRFQAIIEKRAGMSRSDGRE